MYTSSAGISSLLAYCVDRYIASQIQAQEGHAVSSKDKDQEMLQYDERLEAVVERMFERCIEDKQYEQVCSFMMGGVDNRHSEWLSRHEERIQSCKSSRKAKTQVC